MIADLPCASSICFYPPRLSVFSIVSKKQACTLSMGYCRKQGSPHCKDMNTPLPIQKESSSTSVSNRQATMASTASASELSTGTPNTPSATPLSGTAASKKRQRGRRMVTALACTECQKKRAKVILHHCHSIQANLASIKSDSADNLELLTNDLLFCPIVRRSATMSQMQHTGR